ncbi:hypothetical protein [Kitasatospora sp. NPDC091207]|uniref:hypothetical protein n=1 Tax=Kitasatospora sp. NPDC091207 TaxID=3364083 RepID=UPI003830A786
MDRRPVPDLGARADASRHRGKEQTAPGATVKLTSPEDATYVAATVTVPQPGGAAVVLHAYLTAPDGTVNELAVWTSTKAGAQPKAPWAGPADAEVAKAMDAALSTTLKELLRADTGG